MHRFVSKLAAAVTLLFGAAIVADCGGTAVFDAPDPKACGAGHGCPMATCVCGDGSVILDTTCELGECLSLEAVCEDRCEEFEGFSSGFGSSDDEVPIPDCDTFCTRVLVNDCELGCDTLFSQCLKPTTCRPEAAAFWRCAEQQAVLSCVDNAVRIEGCDFSEGNLLCDK